MRIFFFIKKILQLLPVALPLELGALQRWGVFHLRGHKDVPLVTLQFLCKGIKRQSYARSVIVYIGDPVGWQLGLAIGAASSASSATSARIARARELLRNPWCQLEFTRLFQQS
jgi:hypothetical protein